MMGRQLDIILYCGLIAAVIVIMWNELKDIPVFIKEKRWRRRMIDEIVGKSLEEMTPDCSERKRYVAVATIDSYIVKTDGEKIDLIPGKKYLINDHGWGCKTRYEAITRLMDSLQCELSNLEKLEKRTSNK